MKYDEEMFRDLDFHVSAELAIAVMVGDGSAIGKQEHGACASR